MILVAGNDGGMKDDDRGEGNDSLRWSTMRVVQV